MTEATTEASSESETTTAEGTDTTKATTETEATTQASTEKATTKKSKAATKGSDGTSTQADEPQFEVSVVPNSDSEVSLTESGTNLTLDRQSTFLIKVKATFPTDSTTDKSIKISLPYGMSWLYDSWFYPSYGSIDTTAAWYQELKTPVNTAGIVKTTPEILNGRNLYTKQDVTFNFKDGLNTVEFEIGVATMDKNLGYTGLTEIQNAIVVTQGYNNGTNTTTDRKLNLTLTGQLPIYTSVDTTGVTLNGDGEMEVGVGANSGNNVYWTARPGNDKTISIYNGPDALTAFDHYSLSYLVPNNVDFIEVKKQNEAGGGINLTDDSPVKTEAGGKIQLSTGEEYTVPDGMNVWTFKVDEALGILPTKTIYNGNFAPVWSFADSSIKAGDKITIQMLDVNMKYHHDSNTAICDRTNLPSFTYKIIPREEKVFTNVLYTDKNDLQSGNVSKYLLNRGSELYLGKQEYAAGYFLVGNRGSGDSVAKTLHITYDTKNTGIMGVTEQMIPRNKGVSGVKDTVLSNFKVKVWNGTDASSISDWVSMDASDLTTLRVSDIPGYTATSGVYLKEIQYDVDTIPAQSVLGSTTSSSVTSFSMYGFVLTDGVEPQSMASNYISTLQITDQDGTGTNGTQLGRNFTGFTGKISIGETSPAHGTSVAATTFLAGTTTNFSETITLGSADSANAIDEAYYISPYGDELTNIKVTYDEAYKGLYASKNANDVQPEITEVPATSELKAKYPNAKVYKFDFTKLNEQQEFYDARVLGTSVATKKAYEETKYSSYGYVTQYANRISFTATMHTSAKDPVGVVGTSDAGTEDGLVWVKMARPDDLSNVSFVGSNWVKDVYNLTGDTETLLNSRGKITIKAMSDVSVVSSAKMATEPDSAYRTYTGDETSIIGANSKDDYKINIFNGTGKTAKGVEVYVPVPKTGEDWGKNLCPSGAFKFDMSLMDKGTIPEGYTIYYAKSATPSGEKSAWDKYTWTESSATDNWTKADWDAVNFVKVVKDEILDGTDDTLHFNLHVENATKEQMNTVNVWQPYYLRILDSVSAFKPAEPVATTLVPGEVGGTVWYDANANGNIDKGEKVLPGTTVELYDAEGNLKQTVKTGSDGTYLFDGLIETATTDAGTEDEKTSPVFTVKVLNPTDPTDKTDKDRYVEFTTKTDTSDMKFSAASDQKSATASKVSSKVEDTKLQTNAGLVRESNLIGNLKVSKTVTGTALKDGKTFGFTVILGEKLSGTYGDMTFTDGKATFNLGDGQSKVATGLPSRVTYKVEETANAAYETTKTGDEGAIGVQTTEEAAFTNHRDVAPLTLKGVDLPEITKAFSEESASRPDHKTFTFTMAGQSGAPEPKEGTATVSGEGKATSFGDITFTKAGTYTYLIAETQGTASGYSYDKTVYTYVVTVDEQDGNLVVTKKEIFKGTGDTKEAITGSGITFTNSYAVANDTYTVPSVTKAIDGITPSDAAKTFTFALKANGTDAPMPVDGEGKEVTTVTTTGAGIADFGKITFKKAGIYTYEVSEVAGKDTGYTYDESVYKMTVVVTDKDGKLESVGAVTKDNDAADSIRFVNKYEPTSVKTDSGVEKKISGDTPSNAETFTFTMLATDGTNPMPEGSKDGAKSVTIEGAGKAEFGEYTYTKAGTYVYQILEEAGSNESYTYDTTVYTMTDVVTDQDGELKIDRTITSGDNVKSSTCVFTNKYTKDATDDENTNGLDSNPVAKKVKKFVKSVKTGDPASVTLLVIAMLSMLGIVVFITKRRNKKA